MAKHRRYMQWYSSFTYIKTRIFTLLRTTKVFSLLLSFRNMTPFNFCPSCNRKVRINNSPSKRLVGTNPQLSLKKNQVLYSQKLEKLSSFYVLFPTPVAPRAQICESILIYQNPFVQLHLLPNH